MKRILLGAALALTLSLPAFAAEKPMPAGVTDQTFTAPDGKKTLQLTIDIAAPPAVVWKAFADPDFIKTTPGITGAWVDLKNGGVLEEALVKDAGPGHPMNIRHEIITVLPERLMVARNQNVPAGLPGRDLFPTIVQVMQFEPIDGGKGTRFTLSGVGYGDGPGYAALFAFFHEHNAEFLVGLKAQAEAAAHKHH